MAKKSVKKTPAKKPQPPQPKAKSKSKPVAVAKAAAKPVAGKPAAVKPAIAKSAASKPVPAKSVAAKSVAAKSVSPKSAPAKPAVAKPAAAKPVASKTVAPKSDTAKPDVKTNAPVPAKASGKRAAAPTKPVAPAAPVKKSTGPQLAIGPAIKALPPTGKAALLAAQKAGQFLPSLVLKKKKKKKLIRPDEPPVRLPPPPVTSDSKMQKNRAGLAARELEHFRALLLEKRRELLGDVTSMEREALRSGNTNLSTLPVHMADTGTDNYEQEFTLGLVEKDRQLLREINVALAKIQDGSYGLCEGTGKPIAKPRLEAQPWARYSIEHARALEKPMFRRAY